SPRDARDDDPEVVHDRLRRRAGIPILRDRDAAVDGAILREPRPAWRRDGIKFAGRIRPAAPGARRAPTHVTSLAYAILSTRGDISMATPGEQGGAGRAPTDPVPEFRGRDTHGAGDVPPVKVDMGLGPPPARRPAPRPAGTGAAVLIS